MTPDENFFEFLSSVHYKYTPKDIARMNLRYHFIIQKFLTEIAGARVLDLAAHDGRWSYAFAAAGAGSVLGLEARSELISQFATFPESQFKHRVLLECIDVFDGLRHLVVDEQKFDVIALLGIFYHITDHYGLLDLVRQLRPKLVIVDSAFLTAPALLMELRLEDPASPDRSTARFPGQKQVVSGTVTKQALEVMAKNMGFNTEWLDWSEISPVARIGVDDYYVGYGKHRNRFTCVLRPWS
jgi:hypothetical protein